MHIHLNVNWHSLVKHQSRVQDEPGQGPPQEKLWTKGFIAIAAANLFIMSGGNMLMPTIPFFIVQNGGTEMTVGLAAACYSLSSLIMRPIAGWCLDHRSRKGIFILGLIGSLLTPILYIYAPGLTIIILLRAAHGFMYSASSTSSGTNACDIVPPSRFAEGIGMFGLTNSLAVAVAPALGQWVMTRFGFPPMFFLCAAMSAAALLSLRFVSFSKPYFDNRSLSSVTLRSRIQVLFNANALPASSVMGLACIPGGAISSFIALYAAEEGVGVGAIFFVVQAIFTGTVRLFSGKLADRRGEGPPLYGACVAFLLALTFIVAGHSSWLFYSAAALYGIGYGLSVPALQTMAVRSVSRERRGSASSTYMCAYDISWALGGLFGGALVSALGYRPMFAILSLGVFSAAALYLLWARHTPSAFRQVKKGSISK